MELTETDFSRLPKYEPRRFVSEEANLGDKDAVVEIYQKLIERPINSSSELSRWIRDRSELEAVLEQHSTLLYIRMTCQTDSPQRAQAYRHFIETVVPAVKPLQDQLNLKYLGEAKRFPLDPEFYRIYDRKIKTDAELFNSANVPLQTQEALLCQDYQTLCGALTVQFEGRERTLPEMTKFLLEPQRSLRESAWRATAQRRYKEKDRLDELFDRMLSLRRQMAQNSGCKSYTEYQFRAYHRFDYTPEDCQRYHDSVERLIIPLWAKILKKRKELMHVASLRPWDLLVDPLGRPGLKPFSQIRQLIDGVNAILERTDPELGRQFSQIANLGLLDLSSRKGKAPGGYQSTLTEARKPFIFMNAVGIDSDVRTLLHEAGHAFHALACAHQPVFLYRHAPMEFCEVASMSMELLGGDHLDVFYGKEDYERSQNTHLEDCIQTLIWVATIDAFQYWIYENPTHDRTMRMKQWLSIRRRFGGNLVDWSGLEDVHAVLWHRQLHIFEAPFYYIEYGIAQLGALQLWRRARRDQQKAMTDLRAALALGGSQPLPKLFERAGIRFDFSAETIGPLIKEVAEQSKLP